MAVPLKFALEGAPPGGISYLEIIATAVLAFFVARREIFLGSKKTTSPAPAPQKQEEEKVSDKKAGAAAIDLIRNRRSIFVKQFDKEKRVPRAVMCQMLELANWAPTHKLTEPWRFAVFEDEEARRQLGLSHQAYYKAKTKPEKFSQGKFDKKLKGALASSFVVAICMRRCPEESLAEKEEIAAVAMAVQNMHLYACSVGVGAYWSSGGLSYTEEIKTTGLLKAMELGEKDKCLGFLYVGMPGGSVAKRWPAGSRHTSGLAKAVWLQGADLAPMPGDKIAA